MHRIISIDIGTSRVKCALFDETGTMSVLESLRLKRTESPDVQDAEEWFAVVCKLLQEVTAKTGGQVEAVALTGNMHALLGVDATGTPVAPARLWSDNRAQRESDELNNRFGELLLEKYGNSSIPVFTLPKIIQMKREQPELYRKSVKFLQSKEFIAYRITGEMVTEPTDASGVLGMELFTRQWDGDFFHELGLDVGKMPDIVPSSSICGKVAPEAAALTGLRTGTPVVIGCGDLASAALGSGVDDETISLTLGTAGQLLATGAPGDGKKLAGQLFVFAHADPTRELYLGSVPAGGFALEWFANLHQLSMEQFFKMAEQGGVGDDSPVFLPYILGRGAPSMDYRPAGAWFGLSAEHTLSKLCTAAVFGVLCPLRQCADLLEQLTWKRQKVTLQALACRETAVRHLASALFHQQKLIPENSEASLLGAAMLGFTGLGVYPDVRGALMAMARAQSVANPSDKAAEQAYRRFLQWAVQIECLYK
ncbi:MAG: hypothetical protein IKP00_06475 [Victivallales bacterium]|nr:hypothetical protein [Victivallales bacterium]